MSPWTVLGWLLVVFVTLVFILPIVVRLGIAIGEGVRDELKLYRLRRAHKGKVTCEQKDCRLRATRKTPRGFYCEDHFKEHWRYAGGQYAFPLKYTRNQEVT